MTTNFLRPNQPEVNHLHPIIYKCIVGFVVWMMLPVWSFFSATGYSGLELAVVTMFATIVLLMLYKLSRIYRKACELSGNDGKQSVTSFQDWIVGRLSIWQGRIKSSDAAIAILLPPAAAAIGLTALAVVHHLVIG